MSDKTVLEIRKRMRTVASVEKARVLTRFFKTGKGQYGEGDKFLGIAAPEMRRIVKAYRDISKEDILEFLCSEFHEERLFALLVMVDQFRRGDEKTKKDIFDIYLSHTSNVNSWDLVDLSADKIVGAYLEKRPRKILLKLAGSDSLWERRISIISTFHFIKNGESEWTFEIAKKLLSDKEDLMHKAVGWMLREVGKRCSEEAECRFLDLYANKMPRTSLRYAIERFDPAKKKRYMEMR